MAVKFDSMQDLINTLQPQNAQPKKQAKKEHEQSTQQFDVKRFILSWLIWIVTMLIAAPIVTISYHMIIHALK